MKQFKLFLIAILILQSAHLAAQIRLPKLIGDGVVLQRNTELKIWGKAAANENVEFIFNQNTFKTQADESGSWEFRLPAQEAGGPHEMLFKASNEVTVQDVLFGDVWVCSGQSNMELTMERVNEKYREIISNSENRNIRQFLVSDKYDFKNEHSDFDSGNWVAASPESLPGFSAVAYFFARELYEKYQIPIGLINAALGGSPVEAWMSEDALADFPTAYNEAQKFKNDALIAEIETSDKHRIDAWYAELNRKDKGNSENSGKWSAPNLNDESWDVTAIPGYWADASPGAINGVVWFRKEIDLPPAWAGKEARLKMGRIVDQDFVYVNGEMVGTTGYQYPPRRYEVPANILKAGKNSIAVRVINNSGRGGFVHDKPYYLAVDNDTINLAGSWKYKLGATMPALASQTFIRWKPVGLYNRMIAPLLNFSIKGVIWYQGESNTDNAGEYTEMFSTMIRSWRAAWNQGDFPFLFVQLANFMETSDLPVESTWAALRQAQLETLSLPNTGMAVTIDLGEWNDIHPLNKQDVGRRLVLQARKIAHGETNLVASGPIPESAKFETDKVIINFRNTGSGLVAKGGMPLNYFAISADGKNFVWAQAEIKGKTVEVQHEGITNPQTVRYAWANNPVTANLYNKEGLPATPFEVTATE